jgi:transketolase
MMKRNPAVEYGKALLKLAQSDRNVVALDADLCKATMSVYIENELPGQYIEMGIAEQNMVATAAGLAATGKIPFCHTFAVFLAGRAFDQIRQAVCLANLNVKLVGSSAGLSDFGDGATHQTVEDVAIMRALPNMTVVVPADGLQAAKAVEAAYRWNGPVYLRLTRSEMPDVSKEDEGFEIGKAYVLREGGDITLFACGITVAMALEAADALEKQGISACVVNVPTIKPLDVDTVVKKALQTGRVLTCEEHSVIGGLGEAVAGALRRHRVEIEFMGIEDMFGQSSNTLEPLLEHYNLTAKAIVNKVNTFSF